MIGVPPSLSGGLQDTSADLSVTFITRRPTGGDGTSVETEKCNIVSHETFADMENARLFMTGPLLK